MASIDRSAMDAMKKDLSSNPRLRHQYGYEATAAAVVDEDEPVAKKITPKKKNEDLARNCLRMFKEFNTESCYKPI